jgi:hypothetical protein
MSFPAIGNVDGAFAKSEANVSVSFHQIMQKSLADIFPVTRVISRQGKAPLPKSLCGLWPQGWAEGNSRGAVVEFEHIVSLVFPQRESSLKRNDFLEGISRDLKRK